MTARALRLSVDTVSASFLLNPLKKSAKWLVVFRVCPSLFRRPGDCTDRCSVRSLLEWRFARLEE